MVWRARHDRHGMAGGGPPLAVSEGTGSRRIPFRREVVREKENAHYWIAILMAARRLTTAWENRRQGLEISTPNCGQ